MGRRSLRINQAQLYLKAAHAIDCSDTLLRSECLDQQIVGLGLNNIIAIAMPDAVLIAQK